MEITLNFTSKGLIHAIRTKLEQQKKEGKITGDISYKNIATCDFWEKLSEINDRHSKNNKVFHGKGFGCEDKGKNTDWTKTIVVYGSTTFKDEEWEELLGTMMGLKLTKQEEPKAEEPVQPKVEETKAEEAKVEQPKVEEAKVEEVKQAEVKAKEPSTQVEGKKKFKMPIATMAALMQTLEDSGYEDYITASDIIQTKLNCNVVLTKDKELKIYNADKENPKELTKKDENGKTILSNELREALDMEIQKENAQKAEETKTETPVETETEDDENCTEDEE